MFNYWHFGLNKFQKDCLYLASLKYMLQLLMAYIVLYCLKLFEEILPQKRKISWGAKYR